MLLGGGRGVANAKGRLLLKIALALEPLVVLMLAWGLR